MFVSVSKNCQTIKIRIELEFYCNALGMPNANREKLNVSIIKRENSLRKFLALQNHAERVVLGLQRNI